MPRLSVILITYNEEAYIEVCLCSVQWADETVVLDSHSQDGTLSVCRRFTDKCYQATWSGFGQMKNAILDRATGEWVLSIDADERVTPKLAQEILQAGRRAQTADLIFRPLALFLKMYLIKAGFLDGLQGLVLSGLSVGYVFNKYAKLWELGARPHWEEVSS